MRFEATADGGLLERRAADRWRWQAPSEPGTYLLGVHEGVSRTTARLRIFVMRPYGRGGDQLAVMSGYRTPQYNAAIGNRTSTSRHLFGDAADVYVDRNDDGRMDDTHPCPENVSATGGSLSV